jgi:hypothetical protein
MAVQFVPTVKIDYIVEDQRQGESNNTATLTEKEGNVYLPEGTYSIVDLQDAMKILINGAEAKTQHLTPKPERP